MTDSFSRRQFVLGSLALPAFAAVGSDKELQPGIVLILVDWLPAWVIGCYGNKDFRTPNLDRFAQTGVRFANHYAAAPAPAQNRAALLTGRTTLQLRNAESISAPEIPLSAILAKAGYGLHATAPGRGDAVLEDASKFLDLQAPGKPFLLEVSFSDLVPPYDGVPAKFQEIYAAAAFEFAFPAPPVAANARQGREMLGGNLLASLRAAGAAITALDARIGALLAQIDRKGLLDNTLVVLTSTGGALFGQHGLWGTGEASDPVNMYQEVVATPMIWRWPLRIPPNTRRPELVGAASFVPSLCDTIGVNLPERNYCSRSYALVAAGKPLPRKEPWRNVAFSQLRGTEMVCDSRYKLVIRDGGNGPGELYDLRMDPRELTNQYDNPGVVSVRQALAAELTRWKESCSS